ncbi:hypothetical protein EVAR_99458_1 [Eumeta japonica]|uniref:Uncharacterized protein n=1 Tax=Eumeta variegata TaxID=151549 RepID=A0A4C1Z290_EUMVA|nr:hypothetical protein EVAR_99458_1 [Eumeta japonica]
MEFQTFQRGHFMKKQLQYNQLRALALSKEKSPGEEQIAPGPQAPPRAEEGKSDYYDNGIRKGSFMVFRRTRVIVFAVSLRVLINLTSRNRLIMTFDR